jgi:hypothetical protein
MVAEAHAVGDVLDGQAGQARRRGTLDRHADRAAVHPHARQPRGRLAEEQCPDVTAADDPAAVQHRLGVLVGDDAGRGAAAHLAPFKRRRGAARCVPLPLS